MLEDVTLTPVYEFARLRYNLFLDNFTAKADATTNTCLGTYQTTKRGNGVFAIAKFTNIFRFLDRVSQGAVAISNATNIEPSEHAAAIYLFRLFNNLETWDRFPYKYNAVEHLNDIQPWIDSETANGRSVYGRAYLLSSAFPYRIYIEILQDIIESKAYETLLNSESLATKYDTLQAYKGFGEFLAYQFALDFSYYKVNVEDYDSFVIPGVGAVRGASRVFDGLSKRKLGIVMSSIAHEWKSDFKFFGWNLKGNDVQNIFCEFDKYARLELPDLPSKKGQKRVNTRQYRVTKAPYDIYFPKSFVEGFEAQKIYGDTNETAVPESPSIAEQLGETAKAVNNEYESFIQELNREDK